MHKGVKAAIGIGIAAIIVGLASPLFYESEVNEPLPVALNELQPDLTFDKFSNMDDKSRQEIVDIMPENVKDMIMDKAETIVTTVSEDMDEMPKNSSDEIKILKSGQFEGEVGHNAEGDAKIIQVGSDTYLRFENFQVTNGPDLRVYLTNNGDVETGLHLEKLKGSKGDQNYSLANIDFEKYNSIVIYCQPFGVHFGQAQLN